jgi:hypothetical protein
LQIRGRDLLQAKRLPHRAREPNEHAETLCLRAGGNRQRIAQVGRAVGVGCVSAARSAGEHDGDTPVIRQLEPQRRFLHRVGAVSDHHAVGVRHLAHRRTDAVPVGGCQHRAVHRHQVYDLHIEP